MSDTAIFAVTVRVPFDDLTGLVAAISHVQWFESRIGATPGGVLTLDENGDYEQPHVRPPGVDPDVWESPGHVQEIEVPAEAHLVVSPARIEAAESGVEGHQDLVVDLSLVV